MVRLKSIIMLMVVHSQLVCSLAFPSETKSLYNHRNGVNILYSSNASHFVRDLHQEGRKLQLVQFYSSWCGHCISFAPSFKAFLNTILTWTHWLDISVVDCAVQDNLLGACQDFDVQYYPCLKMFWFKPGPKDTGNEITLKGKHSAAIEQSILNWVTNNSQLKPQDVPRDWPGFVAVKAQTVDELNARIDWSVPNQVVVLVVEKSDGFVARRLMAHLFPWRARVRILRVEHSNSQLVNALLPNAMDKFALPFTFVARNKLDGFKILPRPLADGGEPFAYYRKTIEKEFLSDIPGKQLHPPKHDDDDNNEIKKIEYPDKVHMSDLHNAIRHALYFEVLKRPQFDLQQINAVIGFLSVLHDNFPFANAKTKEFVSKLQDWLTKTVNGLRQSTQKSVSLKTSDIKATMDSYEQQYHLPPFKPWQACANVGEGHGREYPCSLWTLFHVLVVAEYRRALQSGHWQNLHPSLFAMRGYVHHFFGCRECATHFQAMASELENELTRMNSSMLWLWRAHNRVNARLKGTGVDNPMVPKRQFPTVAECPYCYNTIPTKEDEDDADLMADADAYNTKFYNQAKVLQFLVTFYGAERIVPDDQDAHKDGGLFTSLDYSLLILFYCIAIVAIFLLVRKLRRRSRPNGRIKFAY